MRKCPECGRLRKHTAKCGRNRPERLKEARDWFARFGFDISVISPTGSSLFRRLLAILEDEVDKETKQV